jgi:AGZA family xanthine/uracil permease-like MFS transporter
VSLARADENSTANIVTSGIFVYAVLNGAIAIVVWISRGKLEPREYDLKEYWTWRGHGKPPWFVRAIKRGWKNGREGSKHGLNTSDNHDSSFEHTRLGSSDNKTESSVVAVPQRAVTPRDSPTA